MFFALPAMAQTEGNSAADLRAAAKTAGSGSYKLTGNITINDRDPNNGGDNINN